MKRISLLLVALVFACSAGAKEKNLIQVEVVRTDRDTHTDVSSGLGTTIVIHQQDAYVRAIMPDGRHVTLWCQTGFRACGDLEPGSYAAEVKGNAVWIYGHQLSGKQRKIKYRWVSGW